MDDTGVQEFEAAFLEASGAAEQDAPLNTGALDAAQTEQDADANQSPPEQPDTSDTDIWANVPSAARAAYEAAELKARNLEHRLRSDDGRVARFQRERDEANKARDIALNSTTQKTDVDLRQYIQSEEWQSKKADYGDDLGSLFTAVERLAEQQSGIADRFGQMDQAQVEDIDRRNLSVLTERAPDWRDLLSREGFAPWLESQPRHIQEAFERNREILVDVDEATDVVNRFRAVAYLSDHNNSSPQFQPDPKRARQLDAAQSVRGRQPIVAETADDFDGFFQQAVAANEKRRALRG